MFEKATNFEELFKIIQGKKEVVGLDGSVYLAGNLVGLIEEVRENAEELQQDGFVTVGSSEDEIRSDFNNDLDFHQKIRHITRSEGLREKVFELVIKEAIARRTSEESDNTIIPKTPDKG